MTIKIFRLKKELFKLIKPVKSYEVTFKKKITDESRTSDKIRKRIFWLIWKSSEYEYFCIKLYLTNSWHTLNVSNIA